MYKVGDTVQVISCSAFNSGMNEYLGYETTVKQVVKRNWSNGMTAGYILNCNTAYCWREDWLQPAEIESFTADEFQNLLNT